ncbi:MAG: GDP-mannose 4,6-dehydratase [Cyanobacteriota bacterium]
MNKTALIAGVTGQDGAYLSNYLLERGYRVVGTSRDAQSCDTHRLKKLGIESDVELISLAPNDFRSVLKVLAGVSPDEIYNLAGQTSVGLSFEQPVECMESIAGGTLNFLEVIRYLNTSCRLFSAGSTECFGDTNSVPANEATAFHPRSPYGVAKSTSFWQVANYREAYGIFCCTGILSNHESPLRPDRFVTKKIVQGVKEIKCGLARELRLGNLDIWRDWGWAPEYVEAMHLMLQADKPDDYLIASGHTTSLLEFARLAFNAAGLNHEDHLVSDSTFLRPSDLRYSSMDPSKIATCLGWKARTGQAEIVQRMFDEKLI